jgi:membrane protease YdiL (CAAX protease family)
MKISASSKRSSLKFFVLVFLLAIPLWLLSAIIGNIATLKVPVTDLALAFMPLTAAAILVYKEEGLGGVKMLFKRIFDYKRIRQKIWYLPLIFLMPIIYLLVFGVMRLIGDNAVADNHLLMLPFFFVLFFILAAGEETGWMGYAIDPLQDRWGALKGSLILAIPWWIGHFPSIIHIGGTIADLAWWLPGAIALRILIVWIYNNTGKSLFAAIFFHALINAGRFISFPSAGSHYNKTYQAVGYLIITITALIVTFLWDPKTLTRESRVKKYMNQILN